MFINLIIFNIFAAYKCHGGWKENGTMHQIISSDSPSAAGWRKLYCLAYVKWPPDRVQVFVYADNCNPNNNRTTTTAAGEGLVLSFNISLSPSSKSRQHIYLFRFSETIKSHHCYFTQPYPFFPISLNFLRGSNSKHLKALTNNYILLYFPWPPKRPLSF